MISDVLVMRKILYILSVAVTFLYTSCEYAITEGFWIYGSKQDYYDSKIEAVDLGLPSGLKWATCNLGTVNPESGGDFYAWGDIRTKSNNVYEIDAEEINDISGDDAYDAARVEWGRDWRIPTRTEFNELCNECDWAWTTQKGVKGYKVTGPNGNSIFLPAADNYNYSRISGYYWSSTPYKNDNSSAYCLTFDSIHYTLGKGWRSSGYRVRPVLGSINNKVVCNVSVSSNGGGSVAISGSSDVSKEFTAGSMATVIATPVNGYNFIGWFIADSETPISVEENYTFPINKYMSLVAKFAIESEIINGYEAIDLGLSVKWATCNVGASTPEDYGGYYAWGEIENKSNYSYATYEASSLELSDISGTALYDVACAKWGSNWRMPTKSEIQELKDKCTWKWTTQNGVNGYKITGPNGNCIFLPAAGYRRGSELYNGGNNGYYWSSSLYDSLDNYAYFLYFYDNNCYCNYNDCFYGRNVRPVTE